MTAVNRPSVVRVLGFAAAASVIVCNVIGQGIFLKTRVMTCEVGSAFPVMGVWIVAGLLTLAGALSVAELGAMFPRSGGIYVFLRRAYGPIPAFAFGWMTFWVAAPAAIAALASGAAIFLDALSGHLLGAYTTAFTIFGLHVAVNGLQWVALLLIAMVSAVNLAPVGFNGKIATMLTVVKIAMIAALAGIAFLLAHGSWTHFTMSAGNAPCAGVSAALRHGLPAFAAAFIAALYAYQGWTVITSIGGEIKNPNRTIPWALFASTIAIIVCYLVANVAYFFAMTPHAIASLPATSSIAVEIISRLSGHVGQSIAAAVLFISTIATLHTSTLSQSRMTYALTSDGVLFPMLGVVTSRSRVPARAVLANGLVAAVLAVTGSFESLTNYYIFNVWLFNIATIVAVFVLVATWIVVQTFVSSPRDSSIGLLIIAAGLVFYLYRSTRVGIRDVPDSETE